MRMSKCQAYYRVHKCFVKDRRLRVRRSLPSRACVLRHTLYTYRVLLSPCNKDACLIAGKKYIQVCNAFFY